MKSDRPSKSAGARLRAVLRDLASIFGNPLQAGYLLTQPGTLAAARSAAAAREGVPVPTTTENRT